MLSSTVALVADLVTHFEDCLASVVYGFFFQRVNLFDQ